MQKNNILILSALCFLAAAWGGWVYFSSPRNIGTCGGSEIMPIPPGGVFTAELTKLDGSKLTLPDDMKGKVVLVDFWASWCGPCRASMPHLKKLYSQYKNDGLEIVGISLDTKKTAMTDYIESTGIPWTQTYSAMGWNDPTARKYGVNAIPRLMLLSREGKIISSNAHRNIDDLLKEQFKK